MNFLIKVRENALAALPIVGLVLILHVTWVPLGTTLFLSFLIGAVLLILGLSVFLVGTDVGILPMGEHVGSEMSSRGRLSFLLVFGALIGFSVTLAEPDLQVLAKQVTAVNPAITAPLLIVSVSLGSGLLVALGLLRILFGLSLKKMLFLLYAVTFGLAAFAAPSFLPMAFDSGGVTTGAMTVPFIMALGIGVAQVRRKKGGKKSANDNFGLVSFMSIGPILMVLILGVLFRNQAPVTGLPSAAEAGVEQGFLAILHGFTSQLLPVMKEVALAMSPLVVLFAVFQFAFLKLPADRFLRMLLGALYTYVGLVIFLLGVGVGFSPVGSVVGAQLATGAPLLLVPAVGVLLGFSIVFAEPSVWVLIQEVEEVTAGRISRRLLLVSLGASVALAVALGFLRVMLAFPVMYLLIPGYLLAFLIMPFTPDPFTGIAFDSGGVSSGVMATTFVLPFALGMCGARGGDVLSDAFGMVALIAMAPLICIQLIGLVYRAKQSRTDRWAADLASLPDERLLPPEEAAPGVTTQGFDRRAYLEAIGWNLSRGDGADQICSHEEESDEARV